MRVQQSISTLGNGDVVNRAGIFAEVLETEASANGKLEHQHLLRMLTVSLKRLPRPNDSGHMRSIKNVTRKKLIFS